MKVATLFTCALSLLVTDARRLPKNSREEAARYLNKRQDVVYPAPVQNYTTISSPSGSSIRYKEPGKAGICETTPGVNSYTGYVDLAPNMHAFFWYSLSNALSQERV